MSVNTAIKASCLGLIIFFLAACSSDKESLLSQKWKSVKIENSSYSKEIDYYKQLMDTMTAANEMVEFFGSVDSFKKVILADLAQQEEIQKTNLENTFMEFTKDKMVYFTSVDGVDSARWRLEDGDIVIEDEEFTGVPNLMRVSILELSKNTLTVRMINQYDTSTISMKSIKK